MNKRIAKKIAKRRQQEELKFVKFLDTLLQKGYNAISIDQETETITVHKKTY